MQTVLSSRSLLCAQAASSRQWLLASATQLQGSSCHFLPYTAEAYLGMPLWGHALCVWRMRESHVIAPIPENGQTCTTNAGLMPALGGIVVSIAAVALLDAAVSLLCFRYQWYSSIFCLCYGGYGAQSWRIKWKITWNMIWRLGFQWVQCFPNLGVIPSYETPHPPLSYQILFIVVYCNILGIFKIMRSGGVQY